MRKLEADIDAARFDPGDGAIEIPVKLKVHDSLFAAAGQMADVDRRQLPLHPAGRHDPNQGSRAREPRPRPEEIYEWVTQLCTRLGAGDTDLVPFEKYARAAEGLAKPSSAARALFGGAEHIERVDKPGPSASPASTDCSLTCWTRSSPWWTSVWRRTGRLEARVEPVQGSTAASIRDASSFDR